MNERLTKLCLAPLVPVFLAAFLVFCLVAIAFLVVAAPFLLISDALVGTNFVEINTVED